MSDPIILRNKIKSTPISIYRRLAPDPPLDNDVLNEKSVHHVIRSNYFSESIVLIRTLGLIPATVFGRITAFCEMGNNECWASHTRLARDCGVKITSVKTAITKCIAAGILKIDQPWKRGSTRKYHIPPEAAKIIDEMEYQLALKDNGDDF